MRPPKRQRTSPPPPEPDQGISAELLASFGLAPDALNETLDDVFANAARNDDEQERQQAHGSDVDQGDAQAAADEQHEELDDATLNAQIWSSLSANLGANFQSNHEGDSHAASKPYSELSDTSPDRPKSEPSPAHSLHDEEYESYREQGPGHESYIPVDPSLESASSSGRDDPTDFATLLAQQIVGGVTSQLEKLNQGEGSSSKPDSQDGSMAAASTSAAQLAFPSFGVAGFPGLDLQAMLNSAARQAVEEVGREDAADGQTPEPIMTENGPVYPCLHPSCSKTFTRLYNLKSHQRTHQDERPFKCSVCPLAFSRNHDLKRHVKIHVVVKPYVCKGCDKAFSRMDALKRHKINPKSSEACQTTEIEQDATKELEGRAETERLLANPLSSAPPPSFVSRPSYYSLPRRTVSPPLPRPPPRPMDPNLQAAQIVKQLQALVRRHQERIPSDHPDAKILRTLANAELSPAQAAALLRILSQINARPPQASQGSSSPAGTPDVNDEARGAIEKLTAKGDTPQETNSSATGKQAANEEGGQEEEFRTVIA
jgi:uncharacterized Zn-finger protein